ncbi:MAG TPA: SDR family oxidoreductase [Burkholderiales bacterium]|jgi:NAD(P)-dependent dehydrogenase (short-subunit alcohol dehydrogenase family)|nr:SDR family oxidoreductase [Burkholderiales bacterium]
MRKRIAVVTGANRGIGYEISRRLGAEGIHIIVASRDPAKGEEAVARLRSGGADAEFFRLDVVNEEDVAALANHVAKNFGAADILVNNAGVMIDPKGNRLLDAELNTFQKTLDTNFYGPLRLIKALAPGMCEANYGRIVNLSSGLGQLTDMGSGTPAYRVSKTALNALTRILASDFIGVDVLVNSMCPGWVRTDMGGPNATRSLGEGADTAVWLATLPEGGPSGGFFRDRQQIPW